MTLATIQSVKPETKTSSDRALSLTLIISHQIRAMSSPNTQTWPPFFSPATGHSRAGAPASLSWTWVVALWLFPLPPLKPAPAPSHPGARLIFSSVVHYCLCKGERSEKIRLYPHIRARRNAARANQNRMGLITYREGVGKLWNRGMGTG